MQRLGLGLILLVIIRATAQTGATLTLTGVVAQRSAQEGFVSAGAGATLAATDTRVDGTSTDPTAGLGHGVIAIQGAALELTRVTVDESAAVGVVVDTSAATLSACHITGNAVGSDAQDGTTLTQASVVPSVPPASPWSSRTTRRSTRTARAWARSRSPCPSRSWSGP